MWWSKSIFVLLLTYLSLVPLAANAQQSLKDLLKRHKDLSEFLELVRKSPFLNVSLPWRQGTLFAPTNDAINEHKGKIDNYTLLYHFANLAKKTTDLEETLSTELPGNTPIWITKKPNSDIFLNDAKLDPDRRNFLVKNMNGLDQVLHVIDRVLDPAVPDSSDSNLLNPDARRFLENSSAYNVTGVHRISTFAKKVAQLDKMRMFKDLGRHTFFIPVDEAFERIQVNTIDSKVIDGHVIPNIVIFLRSADIGRQYETTAFSSSLPVFVSFGMQMVNGREEWNVKSDTRTTDGDAFHRRGVVQTEVVRGNIPVKNGVVHLISKPLVVIDSTVYQTMAGGEELAKNVSNGTDGKETTPTYQFYRLIHEYASDRMIDILKNPGKDGITVFVPSNDALKNTNLDIIKANRTRLEEIIRLHIINKTITSDNINDGNFNERSPFQLETVERNKKLFFNSIATEGNRRTLYVEGGGVNATITQPDIGATNGVIHLIDRVLGFADQTIYQKLMTDPMLQITFNLTNQDNYNLQFNDTNKRFTLFAPSNLAWQKQYTPDPSGYKKMFMGTFGYHVGRIIQRHTIVNQAYTIEQLREISKNSSGSSPIQAIHGLLKVQHRDDIDIHQRNREYKQYGTTSNNHFPTTYDYSVVWNYEVAQVIRPNIECTNGIIHIIDNVLMKPNDVTVTGGDSCRFIPSYLSIYFLLGFVGLMQLQWL